MQFYCIACDVFLTVPGKRGTSQKSLWYDW